MFQHSGRLHKWLAALTAMAVLLVGCAQPTPEVKEVVVTQVVEGQPREVVVTQVVVATEAPPKYVGADMSLEPYIIGLAGYRTGAFQHTGTPLGNGMQDMATLVNLQGGIDGRPIKVVEVETGYSTPRGVEAYERIKTEGNMVTFVPFSTGTTFAVTPKAFEDKIPILHTGYGVSAAAHGETFPYNFLLSPTYWTVEAATTKFIADQSGGEAGLKAKKIGIVYADIDYGRETIPLMEALAEKFGFELQLFPVAWPGLDQAATWTDIAERSKPDWIILRMWGQSTVVSIQEAARVQYPMTNIIGSPWSPTDQDISLAGPGIAKGIKANYWTTSGTDIPIIQTILTDVHDAGKGYGPRYEVGTQLYNRGVYNVAIAVQAIRIAAKEFGHDKPLTPEQVAWGYEHLTPESLVEAGLEGLVPPGLTTSETDHMGSPFARMHEFDGQKMVPIGEWTTAYEAEVQALIEKAALAFKEANPNLYK
jgi:branched-chain amino acid transport system substrate-binding protein